MEKEQICTPDVNVDRDYISNSGCIRVEKKRETVLLKGINTNYEISRLSSSGHYAGLKNPRFKSVVEHHDQHPFRKGINRRSFVLCREKETCEKAGMMLTNFRTVDVYPEFLMTQEKIRNGMTVSFEEKNKTYLTEISASAVLAALKKYVRNSEADIISAEDLDGLIPEGVENVLLTIENEDCFLITGLIFELCRNIPNFILHFGSGCRDIEKHFRDTVWDYGTFDIFDIDEPSEADLIKTLKNQLTFCNLTIRPPLTENKILERLKKYRENLFCEDDISKMLSKILPDDMASVEEIIKGGRDISAEDLDAVFQYPVSGKKTEESFSLIHRENVIEMIDNISATVNLNKIQNRRGFGTPFHHNFIFLGDPGTGKTQAARYLAKILTKLGISNGIFMEVSPNDLIDKYVGHTGEKTDRLCRKVRGGVLFIDEAELLIPGEGRSFSDDAIQSLLKHMEDESETTFIFATYPGKMKELMKSDPGLESRINYTIKFDSYTDEELIDIFNVMLNERGYRVEDDEENRVRKMIERTIGLGRERLKERFGNARAMRTLCEKSIEQFADMLGKEFGEKTEEHINDFYGGEELLIIPAECIEKAAERMDMDGDAMKDEDKFGFKVNVGF